MTSQATRTITKRLRAKRSNGTTVELLEIVRMVPDPTSTGTVWTAPPMRYKNYELATGEDVEKLDDCRYVICENDEFITIVS